MLIIQVALGIVLGALILQHLPAILATARAIVATVLVLGILGGIALWAIGSPDSFLSVVATLVGLVVCLTVHRLLVKYAEFTPEDAAVYLIYGPMGVSVIALLIFLAMESSQEPFNRFSRIGAAAFIAAVGALASWRVYRRVALRQRRVSVAQQTVQADAAVPRRIT